MSDNKRIIKINTDLFRIPHVTRKNRKPTVDCSKIKVKSQVKEYNNATLKRKLMKFMRNQHDKKMKEADPIPTNAFNTEFKGSLDYLSKITKQTSSNNNRTLKSYGPLPKINILSDLPPLTVTQPKLPPMLINATPHALPTHPVTHALLTHPVTHALPTHPVTHALPTHHVPHALLTHPVTHALPTHPVTHALPIHHVPAPSYGCLKGGSLPLYKNWKNQTQKNTNVAPPLRISDLSNPVSINHIKQMTDQLNEIKSSKPRQNKQKRIVRRTYKTGRSKVFPKVSVLVSNRTLRNHITTKSQLLKQTPIGEVKKFLIKTGFIKIGSIAPNDVLRKMYESAALMCGEVTNHNPEYLLYNFMNGPDH